ncbi:MAG: UvrB/UvrC motif-containing protein [Lachnospiraceae bacterium]|nr:UvrB/UvrC motif-containing protein [Lachnospiraceae bacterium]
MLCEKCKKNQATIHMTQVINGDVKEIYLCPECAANEEYSTKFSFHNMFQELFNLAASPTEVFGGFNASGLKCPVCGQTYEEFKKLGKLGCVSCYSAFSQTLDHTLKSIHGSNEHKGKIPQKSGGKMLAKREKENLKRQLAVAIEKEEYEEAAKIRDRIRNIEKEGGEQ